MASLSNYVSLTISQDSVGAARAGFGLPLILSATADWATDLIRFYTSLADVAVDFAVTTSAEYLAAQALFAQSPRPERIAIGKTAAARRPTQRYVITPVAANSTAYTIVVKGKGVTTTTVTYTSDASATVAEITAGLTTALNAVVGRNFAAVDDTTIVTVTGTAAGDWFSLAVADPALLGIAQNHADPGVATDLAAINVVDSSWYALITLYNSEDYVKAAAAWVNSSKKLYVFDTNESIAVQVASDGTQGLLDDLKTLGYGAVGGFYHPSPADMLAPALLGRCLPLDPGKVTFAFKDLEGVSAVALTATQRTNLTNRRAGSIETVAGLKVTFDGKVFSTSIGFIDVRRNLDWLEDDMTKGVFEMLAGQDIVPYTDEGIAMVEAEVRASLQRAVAQGVLAANPAPVVTVPKAADAASADKTARILRNVKFTGTLAGAIHSVIVTGVVSV